MSLVQYRDGPVAEITPFLLHGCLVSVYFLLSFLLLLCYFELALSAYMVIDGISTCTLQLAAVHILGAHLLYPYTSIDCVSVKFANSFK